MTLKIEIERFRCVDRHVELTEGKARMRIRTGPTDSLDLLVIRSVDPIGSEENLTEFFFRPIDDALR